MSHSIQCSVLDASVYDHRRRSNSPESPRRNGRWWTNDLPSAVAAAGDADDEFAQLDQLDGMDLEMALAKLPAGVPRSTLMHSLAHDLKVGESIAIDLGRVVIKLEKKSGQQARLRIITTVVYAFNMLEKFKAAITP